MEHSREELAPQEQMMDPQELARRKELAANAMRTSLKKWNSERENNEAYIEKMKRAKEERKREIEADHALLLSMKEDEEAEAARVEEEKMKIEEIGDEKKEGEQEQKKQNFADQKKFQTKEEQEYHEALTSVVKPFNVKSLDAEQLKKKVAELYDIFVNIINDKLNLNKRFIEQDHEMKDLQEKRSEFLDAKAAKKSGIDMEKFYPGKKSHPPKMTIFSKYDNRKGGRTYDDRKDMYDMGTDVVRPQMLLSAWEEKFNAWMNSAPANDEDDE